MESDEIPGTEGRREPEPREECVGLDHGGGSALGFFATLTSAAIEAPSGRRVDRRLDSNGADPRLSPTAFEQHDHEYSGQRHLLEA